MSVSVGSGSGSFNLWAPLESQRAVSIPCCLDARDQRAEHPGGCRREGPSTHSKRWLHPTMGYPKGSAHEQRMWGSTSPLIPGWRPLRYPNPSAKLRRTLLRGATAIGKTFGKRPPRGASDAFACVPPAHHGLQKYRRPSPCPICPGSLSSCASIAPPDSLCV